MNLVTHGFPKAGNHALVKACQLLGVPCQVQHRTFTNGLPEGTTHDIFIVRDPRNIVVSMLRFRGHPVTPGMFLTTFRRFGRQSLVEEMTSFEPWLTKAGHVVRYEDLVRDKAAHRYIAGYLGAPYFPGAWEELPGLTMTWNAVRSDYRTIWTPDVQSAWSSEGGDDLLRRWGYSG